MAVGFPVMALDDGLKEAEDASTGGEEIGVKVKADVDVKAKVEDEVEVEVLSSVSIEVEVWVTMMSSVIVEVSPGIV